METRAEKRRGCTETAWCFDHLGSEPAPEADPAVMVPVLLLSSDSGFLNGARRSLSRAGFAVVATHSPGEAVQLVSELRFDALVIDYDLARCDGIDVLDRIRGLHGDETPPVVVLGAQRCDALASICRRAGAAALHVKSDGIEQLIVRLARLLTDPDKRRAIDATLETRGRDWDVDSLTGLPSEIYFSRRLLGESMSACEDDTPLSLLMITPDRFPRIVERLGRSAADIILRETARTIQGELRTRDCVARYGDSTFAVVLPETSLAGAVAAGRRLRLVLSETEFGKLEQPMAITFSIGVTGRDPGSRVPPEELCAQALRACTGAQAMGGGKVLADNALTGSPLVLVVSPDAKDADLVTELSACPVEVRATETLAEAWDALKQLPVAMVVVSTRSVGVEGAIELLAWTRDRLPAVKRVLAADAVDLDLAVSAVNRAGIQHFVTLPVDCVNLSSMTEELLFS